MPVSNEELLDVLVTADIGYWADATVNGSAMTVTDREDGRTATITPEMLRRWLGSDAVAAMLIEVGDPYQRAAIAALAVGDPDADWDAETGDLIIQGMTLGKITYG